MIQTLKLLLPALIPSWRFFDIIAPSPRIEYLVLKTPEEEEEEEEDNNHSWQEYRPRPMKISYACMLKRMLWNPEWNESLFLASCAERIINNPTDHSQQEIFKHIRSDLNRHTIKAPFLKFRLVFISRNDEVLEKEIMFTSALNHEEGNAS